MKRISIAVGTICLIFAFAAHAERQEKSQLAEPSSPVIVQPNGSCSAPGMSTESDAVWIAGECEKRETARYVLAMGENKAALTILCNTRAAQEAKACPTH